MALSRTNTPVLSKIKIGSQIYYIKDAELQALVDTYKGAVNYEVDTTFSDSSDNLATSSAIADYVASQITSLSGAMHFEGTFETQPDASGYENGDVILVGTAEYVCYNGAWHLFGDEGVYATITGVEEKYVQKTLTIAGIDMADAITADELKTALGLGALAYKDSASGTISGVVTGVSDITYTPAGTISVSTTAGSDTVTSTGTYTPIGTVSGSTIASGSVAIAADESGYQVTGTVSAPTITVTPAKTTVPNVTDVGTLPSYTAGSYTAPSVKEATSAFATEGVTAAIDGDDAEMLVFSTAGTSNALTSTGFDAGSYTAPTYTAGTLPTLGTAISVVNGITSAEASTPTFTGGKIGATFTGKEAAIDAEFAGTQGSLSVEGTYKTIDSASASFTGTEATLTHKVTTEAKTVTVS